MGKRWIYRAVSAMLAALLCAGCGAGLRSGDEQKVLRLALREGIYADVVRASVEQFQRDHHLRCEIVEMSEEELHNTLPAEKDNEKASYDLCMVDGSWMAEYTKLGLLAELDSLGYQLDGDIITATSRVCYRNGHLYLAPFFGNVTVLLYNKLLLKKAGYEKKGLRTLQDALEVCRYARSKGNLGFMYRGDTTNNVVVDFLPILCSYGGWVIDGDNRPTVDTPEFKKAMDFYMELIETGKPETRDNLTIAIANNAAAMAVGWPGWYTPGRNATADYCAISGKSAPGENTYKANIYGIWTLGIPKNCARSKDAVKLLSYLMNPEIQYRSVDNGGVPCRYSVLKDSEVLRRFPQYSAVEEALEHGVYRPIISEWPQFYEILGEEMKKIISGEKTTAKGLSDAQKRLEELEVSP